MLLEKRHTYKPFKYPWAYLAYEKHESLHWLKSEVDMRDDILDWNTNLTEGQKAFLTQLFRFFTQADASVADGYASKFLPLFSGNPEITMMMLSFGSREAIHVDAYAMLIDTLGLPEVEYSAFMDYAAMKDKYDYLDTIETSTNESTALALAVYSAFTEGMQLFSSFAMLMHFERMGRMRGMTNIVRWSLRDEGIHADSMIQLYRTFCKEYIRPSKLAELNSDIQEVARTMVNLEDKFIDLAFSVCKGELNHGMPSGQDPLTEDNLKQYVRHIADTRLKQLGAQPIYGEPKNPLLWLEQLLWAPEHTNFFEAKSTEYTKGSTTGEISW